MRQRDKVDSDGMHRWSKRGTGMKRATLREGEKETVISDFEFSSEGPIWLLLRMKSQSFLMNRTLVIGKHGSDEEEGEDG